MDFGEAIRALKSGQRVTRAGWNGKGMWLALVPAFTIPAGEGTEQTRKFLPTMLPLDMRCAAHIAMWTARGVWQPGWLASQTDMLAEDWQTVDDAA